MNRSFTFDLQPFLKNTALKRGFIFGSVLWCALLAFEVFNFSTTSFALADMMGDLKFAGMRWATLLAVAFCGIDFAGIARLFTPEQGRDEPAEVWYLFGAWLLAATFNAMLTWWGVSVAVANHNAAGGALVGQATMLKVVPVFVAVMVWLVRVLIIGTFSIAGERLFTLADKRIPQQAFARQMPQPQTAAPRPARPRTTNVPSTGYPRPTPKPSYIPPVSRSEPTYHPVGMSAQPKDNNQSIRR
jgi:hypothetical protein